MARYYYVDLEVNGTIEEYKDEQEFFEGLEWNHSIAKEYGDEVRPYNVIKRAFEKHEDYESEKINGSTFLKLTNRTLKDWGYE